MAARRTTKHGGQPPTRRRLGTLMGIAWCAVVALVALLAPRPAKLAAAEPAPAIAKWFAQHCLECHAGPDKKGGLDLTRRELALRGGDSGSAIEPGKPDASLVWQRVSAGDMPPKRALKAEDKALLQKWIAAGAPYDADPIDPLAYSGDRRGGRDWWSFQPLRLVVPPSGRQPERVRGATDLYLQEKLAAKQLTPAPEADRRSLIRRLSFDLLGLPPSPEEVSEFLADERPDAYERLVDRLLASPRHGERWARHWLDVAHFGESDGFEYDRLRLNAWPYRDWVIKAFNDDLPYDEFARRQIAGDLIDPHDSSSIIATGFLVGGAHDGLQPAVDLMRQIMRQDELEDLVATLGQTFLGVTVQCARCHDHKFDPITQLDYYRLSASLGGVRRGERSLPPSGESSAAQRRLDQVAKELEQLETAARRTAYERKKSSATKPADPSEPPPPQPLAAWDFTRDLRDRIGGLHGTLQGAARQDQHGLHVDGANGYAATAPLARPLAAKTLTAVVKLANLEQQGGGVISVQTTDGNLFDAIVYGEREATRWMAGSNGFVRTQSFQGTAEQRAHRDPVHVAITYDADGVIRGYVDGQPYGQSYKTGFQEFPAEKSQVVFGLRHSPVGGNRMLSAVIRSAALFDRALTAREIEQVARLSGDFVTEEELHKALSAADQVRRTSLRAERDALRREVQRHVAGKTYAITPVAAPVTHVLGRGSPLAPGEVATPGGVAAVRGVSADFQLAADSPDADRRRKLADWIAAPGNPLFARAIVNRIWHYHFGQGIVATPNDLGFSGGQPTHPELLDYLAMELQRRQFSLKSLHRELVTTAAYRQASTPNAAALAVDADNRLLWRKSPVRLEAELVRDAVLAVAGQLNLQAGGPGYQDFRPFLRGGTQFYEPLDPVGPAFQRRSVYRTWARGGHNQLLDTFDCPDPSTMTPRRSVTTTPLQALALLNNSFILRMSDEFAARLAQESNGANGSNGADQAIVRAFELACGRPPSEAERRAAEPFVASHGLAAFCRVLLNSNSFLYVD